MRSQDRQNDTPSPCAATLPSYPTLASEPDPQGRNKPISRAKRLLRIALFLLLGLGVAAIVVIAVMAYYGSDWYHDRHAREMIAKVVDDLPADPEYSDDRTALKDWQNTDFATATKILKKLLADPKLKAVRTTIVTALGAIGSPAKDAIPQVEKTLQEADEIASQDDLQYALKKKEDNDKKPPTEREPNDIILEKYFRESQEMRRQAAFLRDAAAIALRKIAAD